MKIFTVTATFTRQFSIEADSADAAKETVQNDKGELKSTGSSETYQVREIRQRPLQTQKQAGDN